MWSRLLGISIYIIVVEQVSSIHRECGSFKSVSHLVVENRIVDNPSTLQDMGGVAALHNSAEVLQSSTHQCGGVLISDRFLLTAAHCMLSSKRSVSISLGREDLDENPFPGINTYGVLEYYIHPAYDNNTANDYNDLAIIKTDRKVLYNKKIWPFCLPDSNQVFNDYLTMEIAGWGKVNNSHTSPLIQTAFVKLVSNDRCDLELNQIAPHNYNRLKWSTYPQGLTNSILCAGRRGVDSCKGDSGGPMFFQNNDGHIIVVGLVAKGLTNVCPLFPEAPSFYTNVANFIDWIYETTGLPKTSGPSNIPPNVGGQGNPGQVNPAIVQNNNVAGPINNPSTNNVVQTNDKRILAKLIGDFGLEMSDMIHQNGEQDTVVFSPLSIATLMTLLMAGMGQQSNSYFETLKLLGYDNACSPNPCDETTIHQLYKDLLSDLTTQNNHVTFSMGNRLYLQSESSDKKNGLNIFGSYTRIAKEFYKAGTETLDFFNDPFGAADRINKWVSTATEGKIPQLLMDPLSPQTKFMAVNTVYFKAPWLKPFVTDGTFVKKFDTGKGKIDMSFMTQIMGLKSDKIDELQATVIELPYKGERYSMFIMKPEGPASLNSVIQMETLLTPDNLNIVIDRVMAKQPLSVSVQIPRMRLRYRAYLKEIIENLGATSVFSVVNADYSRLTSSNNTVLDDIIHEAVMDITEAGTEAATATSSTSNQFGTNIVFSLDQPSLLFIHDSITKVPILWARIVTPESI